MTENDNFILKEEMEIVRHQFVNGMAWANLATSLIALLLFLIIASSGVILVQTRNLQSDLEVIKHRVTTIEKAISDLNETLKN